MTTGVPATASALSRSVPSPCIDICRIAADGQCEGCLRSLDEIARWAAMPAAERSAIMRALPGRRG